MPKFNLPRLISIEVLALVLIVLVGSYFGYIIFKRTQAANLLIPEYDVDYNVATAGIETYNNINKDKYGDVDEIEAAKGEILVRLNDNVPLYEIANIAAKYDMDILDRYRKDKPSYRLRFSSLRTPDQRFPEEDQPTIDLNQTPTSTEPLTIQQLPNPQTILILEDIWRELDTNPKVYCVGLNYVLFLPDTPWGDEGYWPNDPDMHYRMELYSIGAHRAWQKLLDWNLPPGGDGENVWVANIDTGVDLDHPDLVYNIATDEYGKSLGKSFLECEEGKYIEPCKNWIELGGESGGDGIDNDNDGDIDEDVGHGTKVAGIIAETGNNEIGAAGVGFNIKILPLNVYNLNGDSGGENLDAFVQTVIKAIDYATSSELEKVKIINLEFWHPGGAIHPELNEVMDDAFVAGKILVGPAGNGGQGHYPTVPCDNENVICVAAINQYGKKASYSNYGAWVDISALADTYSISYDDTYGNKFGGTSSATAQVSGSIALLFSLYPGIPSKDARDITIQRAQTIYEGHGACTLGCGIVNVGDMLTSQAPLIDSPRCKTRFELGKDIKLKWKLFPGSNTEAYYIFYNFLGYNENFTKPSDIKNPTKIDISQTSHTVYSKEAELMEDGLYEWRIGALIDGDIHWSSTQTVFKHTGAQIENPQDYKIISKTEVFNWEPIGSCHNYIIAIQCAYMPANPDGPFGVPMFEIGYFLPLPCKIGSDLVSHHDLTPEEWNILQSFAQKDPDGQSTTCSWAVAGTQITNPALWPYLEFRKHQQFEVLLE